MKRCLVSIRRVIARGSVALCCLLGAVTVGPPAFAQPSPEDIDRARRLFQRALELEQAQDYGKALDLFREVGSVKLTPQVRFHIATCEENLGKLVTALGGYKLALEGADTVGPAFRTEVETKITNISAIIPKLTIKRGKGAEAATISLDGSELGPKAVGSEIPVDPGPHTITATAPGHQDYMDTVTVAEKESKAITVTMKKAAAPGEPTPGGVAPGGGDTGVTYKKPSRTVPYVVGAAGGAFLIGGGAFALMQMSLVSKIEKACKPGTPDDCQGARTTAEQTQVNSDRDTAKTYQIISIVGAGVGVAAIGTAVVLIFTEPKPPAKTQAGFSVLPALSDGYAGLAAVGRF
jgi:hypothetical protein